MLASALGMLDGGIDPRTDQVFAPSLPAPSPAADLDAGAPQALAFGGGARHHGSVGPCFAGPPCDFATSTFADVLVDLTPTPCAATRVHPPCATPVRRPAWGSPKASYR